jgi:hypothetical protein
MQKLSAAKSEKNKTNKSWRSPNFQKSWNSQNFQKAKAGIRKISKNKQKVGSAKFPKVSGLQLAFLCETTHGFRTRNYF